MVKGGERKKYKFINNNVHFVVGPLGGLFSLKSDSFSKSLCDSETDFDALMKLDESKQFGLIMSPIKSLILSLEFSDYRPLNYLNSIFCLHQSP